jgi:F-type H+-transporting ATPase subunit alpha
VQRQYHPQPVEDQVAVIFAATRGYLDGLPTNKLQDWVARFVAFVHEKHGDITSSIKEKKALDDETEKKLEAAIEEFNKSF